MTSDAMFSTSMQAFVFQTLFSPLSKLRWGALTSIACAVLLGSTACDSVDQTTAIPKEEFDQVYWALRLNHHAITLSTHAPWNTMQFAVAPLTFEEDTLPHEDATITYISNDTNTVSVTPDGTVLAKTTTGSSVVRVIARLTLGNITHADTAFIKVVNTTAPKMLQSLSIQPNPGDSAKVDLDDRDGGLSVSKFLKLPDQNGQPMNNGLIVYYRSLDKQVTQIDRETGLLLSSTSFPRSASRNVGDARIVATVYAYGVSFTDTLVVTIGHSLAVILSFQERVRADGQGMESYAVDGGSRTIGVGGYIVMDNSTFQSLDVRFEDTTGMYKDPGCAGSSLELLFPPKPPPPNDFLVCQEYLLFTQPGTYGYREVGSGLSGVIQVIDERRPLP